MQTNAREVEAPAAVPDRSDTGLVDLRFRMLLGPAAWSALPAAVRQRFSKRLTDGGAVT
ncbi:MAG: DUF4166 domain-containing protein, partial [Rhizobiales bacterium]|nr:DUF4166 domain-containing protein [Rhizobacter sp.]